MNSCIHCNTRWFITRRHWSVNIRKFLPSFGGLGDLVAAGSLDAQRADLLHTAMRAGRSILVSGATHAGNTTWSI
ncbi:MAG: hypothetical protein J0I33_13980 [Microbacterium ginsengisoli]|uniref:hypothetical protein n=1 Tax=Microbacterium TaxID=33882 RepID=UPI000701C44B|nr:MULTISPECIES: hypothetical protein [unclassified Microbacterium]KQS00031.1 hypothetical protein ASG00_11120 [Microbacterium sp. Leaf351]MBN9199739.1 hypothetical protein [Microbacterium ginsengisoli]OJU75261.1 MAG: hypothetical protein BGO15_04350 [Microbacterium sp. 71-23]